MSHNVILFAIIIAYFLVLLGVAFYTSRGSNNESFFVGNRSSKWWLVAFGMIGTSLSGMTFVSVPGTVGTGDFNYFQVVIGYWIGYFIVAFVLLPVYYKMNLTSIYTYLERRMGVNAHKTGAFFFILSRTVGATLRLYLVIKVLEIFVLQDMGISFELTAIIILALILLYTYRGGVKTIVWTDTLQTTFMLLALIISIVYLSGSIDLSLGDAWSKLSDNGMTKIFSTDPMPSNFFIKEILGGMFITISMTGLDQEMMQKNISVSNLKDSQKNMMVMGTLQMIVVFIFLFLGGLLYLYAQQHGGQFVEVIKEGMPVKQFMFNNENILGDAIFPTIAIKSGLPFFITVCFMIGLISALFPSADGALTALTASFCIDILGMQKRAEWDEAKRTKVRLIVHNIFAVIFLLFVFFFREVDNGSLIGILLKLAGFTYGPLLGLFAFGILTKRKVNPRAPLLIGIIALGLTLGLDVLNNYQWYAPKVGMSASTLQSLQSLSHSIFGNYKIGVELLIINAAFTFGLLYFSSKKETLVAA